jgi:predicted kinase
MKGKKSKTLIITVGLPRSSKSTWARSTGLPMVNPDSIRLAIHGQVFIKEAETLVWTHVKYMIESLFIAGHDKVILDATNTMVRRRREFKSKKWKCMYKVFDTSKDECIQRAKDSGTEYLIPVIKRMCKQFEPLTKDEGELYNENIVV